VDVLGKGACTRSTCCCPLPGGHKYWSFLHTSNARCSPSAGNVPTAFVWGTDGTVGSVAFSVDESEDARNLKRGVLSALQVHTLIATQCAVMPTPLCQRSVVLNNRVASQCGHQQFVHCVRLALCLLSCEVATDFHDKVYPHNTLVFPGASC
jgi:hypothetical protein